MRGKERGPQIPPPGRHAHPLCHHLPLVVSAQKILARLLACVKVGKLQQNNLSRPPTAVAETASTHNPHAQRPPSTRSPKDRDPGHLSAPSATPGELRPRVLFSLFSICTPSPPRLCHTAYPLHLPKPPGGGQYDLHEPAHGLRDGTAWRPASFLAADTVSALGLRVIETGTAPIPIRPRPNPQSPADFEKLERPKAAGNRRGLGKNLAGD